MVRTKFSSADKVRERSTTTVQKWRKLSASTWGVKVWDKSVQKLGNYLLLRKELNFETGPYKNGGTICFYLESWILRQVRTKSGELSAFTWRVKFWDRSVQKWGNFMLLLGELNFETSLYKSGGNYLLLLGELNFETNLYKSGGTISFYLES